MSYDNLWAPWRNSYVVDKKPEGCVFCAKLCGGDDAENLVLYRGSNAFVIMNIYPYNAGHLMVLPKRHLANIELLNDDELIEITFLMKRSVSVLSKVLTPDGFNIGYNMGSAAGAGIAAHLHQHIVPRWNGDTNFMPVVGQVKVISTGLHDMYYRLKNEFDELK